MADAKPKTVAPSSARSTTTAQQRRGFSDEQRAQLVKYGGRVAVAGTVAGGGALVAYSAGTAVSSAREANRARVEVAMTPIDTNGDGAPDTFAEVPFVTGPDGAFTSFGGTPSASREPPAGGLEQFGKTAKTVGLVLAGVLVVGGVVYLATNPKAAGALRKAVGR